MRKKAYFHIGAHKTGTTTLQHIFNNRAHEFDGFANKGFKNSKFYDEFKHLHYRSANTQLEDLRDIFLDEFSTYDTLRISQENLIGKPFRGMKFYPTAHYFLELYELLEQSGYDVKILMTVRNRTDFMISWYLQSLAWPNSTKDFQEYANKIVTDDFNWLKFGKQFRQKNIVFLPMELLSINKDEYVKQVNSFFETRIFTINDFNTMKNSRLSAMSAKAISKLPNNLKGESRSAEIARIKNKYENYPVAQPVSSRIREMYISYFIKDDIKFGQEYFSNNFKNIYTEIQS